MSKSTFKILFYLRKNYLNKEGKAGIMIRLSLNGEISQFSSKLDIEPDKWDTTLGKAKGNTQKARQLNETLEDIRASLKNHYRDIEVHESFVTVEKIRNAFLGITAKQRTLLELFKKHNEDARKLVGISKTPATLAKYDRCYRRLEEFMKVKYNISDISLKENGQYIPDAEQSGEASNTTTGIFKRFDIGIPVGVAYEYNNISIDLRYLFGLKNPYKYYVDNIRNRSFSLTVGYGFTL